MKIWHQEEVSSDNSFQDIRLDVGFLEIDDYKGVCKQQLFIGETPLVATKKYDSNTCNNNDDDDDDDDDEDINKRGVWPTSVHSILKIPAHRESLLYKTRE